MIDFDAKRAQAKERKAKRTAKRKTLYAGKPQAVTKTFLKKKLWSAASFFVRFRDQALYGKCRIGKAQSCRGYNEITCAYHLVPSNDGAATRYDPDNLVGACKPCNDGERWHRFKYEGVHDVLFGKEFMDRLRLNARIGKQYSRADLIRMKDRFLAATANREWGLKMSDLCGEYGK